MLLRLSLVVLVLGAVGFGLFGLSEHRRVRAHGDWQGRKIAELEAQIARLEAETARALAQRDATHTLLDAIEAKATVARQDRLEQARAALKPLREDVRLALAALNRCLAADGHGSLRALAASALEAEELHDVELLEVAPDRLGSGFYVAGRFWLELDRARGSLTVVMKDGALVRGGERVAFPAEGQTIVLPEVYGPMWERELPYLVHELGEYPTSRPRVRASADEEYSLFEWRGRLNTLLARAGSDVRWHVERLGAVAGGGVFTDAVLLGYDGRRLQRSIEAERLRVEVDRARSVVTLWCGGGVLREKGGEAPLDPAGWSLLLPGITVDAAQTAMLGFVAEAGK